MRNLWTELGGNLTFLLLTEKWEQFVKVIHIFYEIPLSQRQAFLPLKALNESGGSRTKVNIDLTRKWTLIN